MWTTGPGSPVSTSTRASNCYRSNGKLSQGRKVWKNGKAFLLLEGSGRENQCCTFPIAPLSVLNAPSTIYLSSKPTPQLLREHLTSWKMGFLPSVTIFAVRSYLFSFVGGLTLISSKGNNSGRHSGPFCNHFARSSDVRFLDAKWLWDLSRRICIKYLVTP